MRRPVVVALAALLAGCTGATSPPDPNDWRNWPALHACSPEQMARAQTETAWCSKNTGYFSEYCYAAAIERICPKLSAPPVAARVD